MEPVSLIIAASSVLCCGLVAIVLVAGVAFVLLRSRKGKADASPDAPSAAPSSASSATPSSDGAGDSGGGAAPPGAETPKPPALAESVVVEPVPPRASAAPVMVEPSETGEVAPTAPLPPAAAPPAPAAARPSPAAPAPPPESPAEAAPGFPAPPAPPAANAADQVSSSAAPPSAAPAAPRPAPPRAAPARPAGPRPAPPRPAPARPTPPRPRSAPVQPVEDDELMAFNEADEDPTVLARPDQLRPPVGTATSPVPPDPAASAPWQAPDEHVRPRNLNEPPRPPRATPAVPPAPDRVAPEALRPGATIIPDDELLDEMLGDETLLITRPPPRKKPPFPKKPPTPKED